MFRPVPLLKHAVVASIALSSLTAAQTPRITLKPANATHPEELSSVLSVRELADGRVLVVDAREKRLLALDFEKGTSEQLGREGAGPLEYRNLSRLYRGAGDTTIMFDGGNRRLFLLEGSRVVGTTAADAPALRATVGPIMGADARGSLLARRGAQADLEKAPTGRTQLGKEDSSFVMLIRRSDGRVDTVAKTMNSPRTMEIARDGKGQVTQVSIMIRDPLATEEQSLLLSDGTLVVTRLDPFRVDWRSSDGSWTRGAALLVPRIRVDQRERDAVHARAMANFTPRPGATPPPPVPAEWFPEFVPPYLSSQPAMAGPAGTVIIKRTPSADATGNRYYVMDRRRGLLGEIVLPAERAIVGAGNATLFVSVKDEDDILHLERIPWP